jgi:hypothetical protein
LAYRRLTVTIVAGLCLAALILAASPLILGRYLGLILRRLTRRIPDHL